MDEHRTNAARLWAGSAAAYIAFQDAGDRNRTHILDPVMLAECGDVRGHAVLDIGCGEGRFCRMLAERGALCTGVDATPAMLRVARARGAGTQPYVGAGAEALPFRDDTFDLVISYVVLVDIVRYADAIRETARVLRPGGRLVAANLGFITASQGSTRDETGRRLYHRIDRYADEHSQVYEWAGIRIENWHRPLANYMRAYLDAGLVLRTFLEPVPTDDSLRDDIATEDWFRVPRFNVMRWEKPA